MTGSDVAIAGEALAAFDAAHQIEPFTFRFPHFEMSQAYTIAAAIHCTRLQRGETAVGRKIGFTNRAIWDEYNVRAPIWGYMYAHSAKPMSAGESLPLASFCEPKIEPEVAFGLARAPAPGMNERELLDCIGWVAHGFEIVQSIFPGWRFEAADTIVNSGMHGAFRFGAPRTITPENAEALFGDIANFTLRLSCNGVEMETGKGTNVLGGPLSALRHLLDLLARAPALAPLAAGEIVTTGTVTRAFPVSPGETWSTEISGLPLDGLTIRFD